MMSSAIPVERLAQRRDLDVEVVLFDDDAGPDAVQQLVLRHQGAVRFDQRHEDLEGTAAQLDRRAIRNQLAARRHDLKAAKIDRRSRSVDLLHSASSPGLQGISLRTPCQAECPN